MLKEAIEKILEINKPALEVVEGRTFAIGSEGVEEVRPQLDKPETLPLTSLDALVKLIRTEALFGGTPAAPLYITIPNHLTVRCFSHPAESLRYARPDPYLVTATDVPGWEARTELPFEEALIALRTRFQPTNDTEYALKLLSDITTGAKITFNDNGVATTVVTKKGIDLQSNQPIRPIISLKPYRTFQEVEQPASEYLIRISDRGISFIEADGGMWKLKARQTVKEYFDKALATEIQDGGIVVAL